MTVDVLSGRETSRRPEIGEVVNDRRLVELAARAEAGAFGQLYQRYVEDVFQYVCFRVRDDAVAEDLTHDVFVNALRGIAGLRDGDRFRQWLLRIAHNRVANHWRDRPPELPMPDPDTDDLSCHVGATADLPGAGSVELLETVDTHLSSASVMRATAFLTELQREVISLRFVAGLSVAETAEAMGRSVGAVKNLQHHALAALRRHLDLREVET